MQAQLGAALPNSPNQNSPGTDGTANRQGILFAILVLRDAVPCNHAQAWYLRKTVNDAPGNAHGQIVQIGTGIWIRQGEDGDGINRYAMLRNCVGGGVDANEKAISPARQCLDELRIFCGVAQRIPQLVDCFVQAVIKIYKRI